MQLFKFFVQRHNLARLTAFCWTHFVPQGYDRTIFPCQNALKSQKKLFLAWYSNKIINSVVNELIRSQKIIFAQRKT